MLFQLTGLSGAGKTTIATGVEIRLDERNIKVKVIDGDVYRQTLCKDLSFSRKDRLDNIRRLKLVAESFLAEGFVVLLSSINPFEEGRQLVRGNRSSVRTIWVECDMPVLIKRDPKSLYRRSFLPEGHPDKLVNFTGVDQEYEEPINVDLLLDTTHEPKDLSINRTLNFILNEINFFGYGETRS